MSELDKCFKKGLVRKTLPSREKAHKSISKAKKWLEEAKKKLEFGLVDSCLFSSYSAMFHAARALIIRNGFREKATIASQDMLKKSMSTPTL